MNSLIHKNLPRGFAKIVSEKLNVGVYAVYKVAKQLYRNVDIETELLRLATENKKKGALLKRACKEFKEVV